MYLRNLIACAITLLALPLTISASNCEAISEIAGDSSACNSDCTCRLLYRTAYSSASHGVNQAIDAYDAVEWCTSESNNAWCPDAISDQLSTIAGQSIQNLTIDFDDCDSECLVTSIYTINNDAAIAAIQWASSIFEGNGEHHHKSTLKDLQNTVEDLTKDSSSDSDICGDKSDDSDDHKEHDVDDKDKALAIALPIIASSALLLGPFAAHKTCTNDPVLCGKPLDYLRRLFDGMKKYLRKGNPFRDLLENEATTQLPPDLQPPTQPGPGEWEGHVLDPIEELPEPGEPGPLPGHSRPLRPERPLRPSRPLRPQHESSDSTEPDLYNDSEFEESESQESEPYEPYEYPETEEGEPPQPVPEEESGEYPPLIPPETGELPQAVTDSAPPSPEAGPSAPIVPPNAEQLFRAEKYNPFTNRIEQQTLRQITDPAEIKALPPMPSYEGAYKAFELLDEAGRPLRRSWRALDGLKPMTGEWKKVGDRFVKMEDGIAQLDGMGEPLVASAEGMMLNVAPVAAKAGAEVVYQTFDAAGSALKSIGSIFSFNSGRESESASSSHDEEHSDHKEEDDHHKEKHDDDEDKNDDHKDKHDEHDDEKEDEDQEELQTTAASTTAKPESTQHSETQTTEKPEKTHDKIPEMTKAPSPIPNTAVPLDVLFPSTLRTVIMSYFTARTSTATSSSTTTSFTVTAGFDLWMPAVTSVPEGDLPEKCQLTATELENLSHGSREHCTKYIHHLKTNEWRAWVRMLMPQECVLYDSIMLPDGSNRTIMEMQIGINKEHRRSVAHHNSDDDMLEQEINAIENQKDDECGMIVHDLKKDEREKWLLGMLPSNCPHDSDHPAKSKCISKQNCGMTDDEQDRCEKITKALAKVADLD